MREGREIRLANLAIQTSKRIHELNNLLSNLIKDRDKLSKELYDVASMDMFITTLRYKILRLGRQNLSLLRRLAGNHDIGEVWEDGDKTPTIIPIEKTGVICCLSTKEISDKRCELSILIKDNEKSYTGQSKLIEINLETGKYSFVEEESE